MTYSFSLDDAAYIVDEKECKRKNHPAASDSDKGPVHSYTSYHVSVVVCPLQPSSSANPGYPDPECSVPVSS